MSESKTTERQLSADANVHEAAFAAGIRNVDAAEWERRKLFIGFTDEDARILAGLSPLMARHADGIVDRFYDAVQAMPNLTRLILEAGSTVERLKASQKRYLLELFAGDYGESYFHHRLGVGVMHYRIGLGPQWYLGGFSVYTQAILPVLRQHFRFRPAQFERALVALNRLLSLDSQLGMDAYIQTVLQGLEQISLSKSEVDRRVADYHAFVAQVSTGDLSRRIEIEGDDELWGLGRQLNEMTGRLADMTGEVGEASASVMTAVEQLQQTVNEQSAGASEQASAVSETASTLEEIRVTSGQTRDKALALGQLAERTRGEGDRGQAAVEQTVAAMRDIRNKVEAIATHILSLSEQTQQIGDITGLVSNLAQQLKILALNAAIEAGKVGDAGKGFAVVAGEVRELAEQSQEATVQIQAILQEIQRATDRSVMATEEGAKGVDAGIRLVDQAGQVMRDLAATIDQTTVAGQQIVAAVRQEAAGIDQISAAMKDINGATRQLLTSTQQTRQTTQSLAEIARRLRDRVAVYKL
ncbi:MAG: protoglobin domain-containing protein [Chromatiales bacterium]|nr:protoglobin domain-containing protein [Chromatiales bacterium]